MANSERLLATSETQADTPDVRVTQWTFAPGAATGHHRHEYDYVVVYITAAKLKLVGAQGETTAEMAPGGSYVRPAGVEHDVINIGNAPVIFVEVEMKRK